VDRFLSTTRRNFTVPLRRAADGVGVLRVCGVAGEGCVDFRLRAVEESEVEELACLSAGRVRSESCRSPLPSEPDVILLWRGQETATNTLFNSGTASP
jgi:hypothetical protein